MNKVQEVPLTYLIKVMKVYQPTPHQQQWEDRADLRALPCYSSSLFAIKVSRRGFSPLRPPHLTLVIVWNHPGGKLVFDRAEFHFLLFPAPKWALNSCTELRIGIMKMRTSCSCISPSVRIRGRRENAPQGPPFLSLFIGQIRNGEKVAWPFSFLSSSHEESLQEHKCQHKIGPNKKEAWGDTELNSFFFYFPKDVGRMETFPCTSMYSHELFSLSMTLVKRMENSRAPMWPQMANTHWTKKYSTTFIGPSDTRTTLPPLTFHSFTIISSRISFHWEYETIFSAS